MLLTISTTHRPATDLGFLLHKNPAERKSYDFWFGAAHVFYPEASEERCTVALLLDVDAVGLVRGRKKSGISRYDYVNDRPYVASSFASVALAKAFSTAMGGRSKERPELTATAIPLEVEIAALPCGAGGEELLRRMFEPLGYRVETHAHPLDPAFPEWGESRYLTVRLGAVKRLADLLAHLYVLIPVLDNQKHYWVGPDEVEKLLARGGEWLAAHPERELIVNRYLKYQRPLTARAIARLVAEEQPDPDEEDEEAPAEEAVVEERIRLVDQRMGAVLSALRSSGTTSVVDLGCGEGRLLRELLADRRFTRIAGMDVSHRALEIAARRLRLERMPPMQRERIELFQGSLLYRDDRLAGFDAATVVEVIEHLDDDRLAAFERVVFEYAQPHMIVVTTPNAEYNVNWESLPAGDLRHRDHRFEWTRDQFAAWAGPIADRHGYRVRYLPIGPEQPDTGPPTQMAIFARAGA
jgi:3' terminal RNA ribose 2'-O-methyltransferase Hen1